MSTSKATPKPAPPQVLTLADLRITWKAGPVTAPVERSMTGAEVAGLAAFIEAFYGNPGTEWDWDWLAKVGSLQRDSLALASVLYEGLDGGLDEATSHLVHQVAALLAARCAFQAMRQSTLANQFQVHIGKAPAAA